MRSADVFVARRQHALTALTLSLCPFLGVGFSVAQDVPDKPVLGNTEPVALTNGDTCILVDAKVDTGADRSSIDTELAEALGLDLEDADTATFSSALGETERPLVDVTFHLAGEEAEVEVSVSDRDGLSSEVLLGQDILVGFLVDVESERLTDPFDGDEDRADEPGCDAYDE